MRLFQMFRITGVADTTTFDTGLKSTEVEKKRLISIHIQMDIYAATDDNQVEGWHERAKVFELPEKMFPTEIYSATISTTAGEKMPSVPVDLDIPIGDTFKVAMSCAATATDVRGAYEYEIIT